MIRRVISIHDKDIDDHDDEPGDDKNADPWSAPWNQGYRILTDEQWWALAENSA